MEGPIWEDEREVTTGQHLLDLKKAEFDAAVALVKAEGYRVVILKHGTGTTHYYIVEEL